MKLPFVPMGKRPQQAPPAAFSPKQQGGLLLIVDTLNGLQRDIEPAVAYVVWEHSEPVAARERRALQVWEATAPYGRADLRLALVELLAGLPYGPRLRAWFALPEGERAGRLDDFLFTGNPPEMGGE